MLVANRSVCRASKSPTFLSLYCPGLFLPFTTSAGRHGTWQKPAKTVTLAARKQMIAPPSSAARSKNS